MKVRMVLGVVLVLLGAIAAVPAVDQPPKGATEDLTKSVTAARGKGLNWLAKNQAKDGSWGKRYIVGVTSFAVLAYLSSSDDPYAGDRAAVLQKGIKYLMDQQKDGMFPKENYTWIHSQGFGTLALSEAYGRSLLCRTKPDIDMKKVKAAVGKAVKLINENQSDNGGWWYVPGHKSEAEGSTTVCAVQALVSASNYGFEIDQKVLDKGFAYLKKCQNKDGSFQYKLGDGKHMKEGTCANLATLALMQQFDNQATIAAYEYLSGDPGPDQQRRLHPLLRPFLRLHGDAAARRGIQGR
jgi:prenyltransferase beta subunit